MDLNVLSLKACKMIITAVMESQQTAFPPFANSLVDHSQTQHWLFCGCFLMAHVWADKQTHLPSMPFTEKGYWPPAYMKSSLLKLK